MATQLQIEQMVKQLKDYKRKYIKKTFSDLDESGTRIMINAFLTQVLGYTELDEIKTEYNIRGEYADYVIQTARKKQFVVEVKSIQIDINEKHLRQSLTYAANEGIDWIFLTNGRQVQVYRVLFEKPMKTKLLIDMRLDTMASGDIKKYAEELVVFTKSRVLRNEHELFWQRKIALDPQNISKLLYCEDVLKVVRRELKKTTGMYFDDNSIKDALIKAIHYSSEVSNIRYRSNNIIGKQSTQNQS
jgi:hypothetical protein